MIMNSINELKEQLGYTELDPDDTGFVKFFV